MQHEELVSEIKKILEEELREYLQPLENKISPESKQKIKDAQTAVTAYVQEKPLQSLGLAFLAGVLVSKMLTRGSRDL